STVVDREACMLSCAAIPRSAASSSTAGAFSTSIPDLAAPGDPGLPICLAEAHPMVRCAHDRTGPLARPALVFVNAKDRVLTGPTEEGTECICQRRSWLLSPRPAWLSQRRYRHRRRS